MVSNLPYGGNNTSRNFYPDGLPLEQRDARFVNYRRIAPGYFETMGIPFVSGRMFTEADRHEGQQVAIVSRLLVERYWPNADPVGRRFKLAPDGADITVVGVVGDVLHDWFQQARTPTVYRPMTQDAPFQVVFIARTIGDPESIGGELREAVRAEDPDQPVMAIQSMEQHIEDRTGGLRFIAGALGVSAAIALALALLGLYSLMAFMVSRRTQELGVRLALGATRWQVIGLTTAQGLRITAVGLVVGAMAAFALGRLMESTLFGIVTTSAVQLAMLMVIVATVSLLASYLPARRTARLDPTTALRSE
jgi:putative ABC transport system permease protein